MTQLSLFTKRKAKAPSPALEKSVHISIADHLRHFGTAGWVWWHTPNGGYWLSRATAGLLQRMGVKKGVSDFSLVGPPHGKHYALELKRRGEKPTPHQLAFIEAIRATGGEAEWTDDFDEALEILKRWGALTTKLTKTGDGQWRKAA